MILRAGQVRETVAERMIPLLPEAIQSRIVGPHATWRPRDLRQIATSGAGEKRLLIGPANYAGQGYLWARAAEQIAEVSARSLQYKAPGSWAMFPADTTVRTNVWRSSGLWKDRQDRALAEFTHVIVEAGRPIVRARDETDDALRPEQVERMLDRGLTVALLWHGSDIRTPSLHSELEPHAPYAQADPDWVARLEATATANHALADALALPEFVSNPYLRSFRRRATWLPTLSDPARWKAAPLDPASTVPPVVLHVPSSGVMKGSKLIREVMLPLHDQGIVTYLEASGVRPTEMPALVASSDLIIDGIVNGQYGVASIEAMLSGRVAVAHTWSSTRKFLREQVGLEVPVVEANPETLDAVVRALASDPARRRALGDAGREFALRAHSPSSAAASLAPFLGR